jgi:hypothetical protein
MFTSELNNILFIFESIFYEKRKRNILEKNLSFLARKYFYILDVKHKFNNVGIPYVAKWNICYRIGIFSSSYASVKLSTKILQIFTKADIIS